MTNKLILNSSNHRRYNYNKNSILVTISLILSIAIGLAFANKNHRGVSASETSKKIIIGFSMDTLKEARWQKDRDIFVKRANDLGAEVIVQSANSDDVLQMKNHSLLKMSIS